MDQLSPMLASDLRDFARADQERIWNAPDFIAEEKLDGVRAILHIGAVESRLTTRVMSKRTGRYLERSDNFPHLRDLPLGFLAGTIIDGELLLDKPRLFTGTTWAKGSLSCTMAVCNSSPARSTEIQRREGAPAYWAFDLIRDRGQEVRRLPFIERRRRLERIFGEMRDRLVPLESLKLVPQVVDGKRAYYAQVVERGGEGVMLKNRDAFYQHEGRSRYVLKFKKFLTVDGFIIGSTPGRAGNSGQIGSLLIGVYDATTGLIRGVAGVAPYDLSRGPNESNLRRAMTVLRDGMPELAPGFHGRVVEIEAFCWNKNARLVHAKLARFRPDKDKAECRVDFSSLGVADAVDPGR